LIVSVAKTKSVVKGKEISLLKIVIDNRVCEQDKTFKYGGRSISVSVNMIWKPELIVFYKINGIVRRSCGKNT
jgi:hypothetical protein